MTPHHASRPLRSLMLGDTDYYFSPYIFGVAQACPRLGVWHTQMSIRAPLDAIVQRIRDVRPDLLWTHMLLWAPAGAPPRESLLAMCADARRRGARVILHDGDVKERCRHPSDISAAVDLALCNHQHDRSPWQVPALHWPYAAFPQDQIADPVPEFACDVAFAGQLGNDAVYASRTRLVDALRRAPGVRVNVYDGVSGPGNTMLRTPELAASALTVLGMGRPVPGWVDTRVFQYPGAGAILLHDNVGGWLRPDEHYIPYASDDPESVVAAVRCVQALTAAERMALRQRAFAYVQARHSYVARVREVLAELGLDTGGDGGGGGGSS